jgi:hypothetical protein
MTCFGTGSTPHEVCLLTIYNSKRQFLFSVYDVSPNTEFVNELINTVP